LRTRAIPERLRGVITTRRYTNPRLPYLTLPYLAVWCRDVSVCMYVCPKIYIRRALSKKQKSKKKNNMFWCNVCRFHRLHRGPVLPSDGRHAGGDNSTTSGEQRRDAVAGCCHKQQSQQFSIFKSFKPLFRTFNPFSTPNSQGSACISRWQRTATVAGALWLIASDILHLLTSPNTPAFETTPPTVSKSVNST